MLVPEWQNVRNARYVFGHVSLYKKQKGCRRHRVEPQFGTDAHESTYLHICTRVYLLSQLHTSLPTCRVAHGSYLLAQLHTGLPTCTVAHESTYSHSCTRVYLLAQLHTSLPTCTVAHESTYLHSCTRVYLLSQLHTSLPTCTVAHGCIYLHSCTLVYLLALETLTFHTVNT